MRLDRWLWAVRIYKTRSLALAAIKAGHALVNAVTAKPAHEVRVGALITARQGPVLRTLRVLGAPASRVAGRLVPQFAEDLTPPEEYEKARGPSLAGSGQRPPGSGRPTKQERREIDRLTEE